MGWERGRCLPTQKGSSLSGELEDWGAGLVGVGWATVSVSPQNTNLSLFQETEGTQGR